MNLFYLSEDPEECAEFHCNKHVPKMVVETAQLLCNVHHRQGELPPLAEAKGAGDGDAALPDPSTIPYKYSRSGHAKLGPMVWLFESLSNYRWAVAMGLALSGVYTRRFGQKTHKTQRVLEWLRANEPLRLRDVGFTRPRLAMPEEYKHPSGDPIASYRKYYVYDKHRFAEWPEGLEPAWFTQGVQELKAQGLYNNVSIAYPTKLQAKAQKEQQQQRQKQKTLPTPVKRKRRATGGAAGEVKVEGAAEIKKTRRGGKGHQPTTARRAAASPTTLPKSTRTLLRSVARRLGL